MPVRDWSRTLPRALSRVLSKRWGLCFGAGAALVWLVPACLNPHTDDQPTFSGSGVGGSGSIDVLPGQSCPDNPLLAGCSSPPSDHVNEPAGGGGSASVGGAGGSAGSAGDGGVAGSAGGVGMPFAEDADGGASDAGAGDAGLGDANAP
jgi:hypothetical protein